MSEGVDMNSPAETHGAILNAIVRRFAAARLLAADEGDPDVLLAALDRALDAARVAVVRPTSDGATAMRDEIAAVLASWESWDDDTRRIGGPLPDLIADNLDVWNGFGAPAVVRPTRDALAGFLADRRNDDLPHPFRTGVEPRDFDLADALLKAFWPLAVSDSQETPTP